MSPFEYLDDPDVFEALAVFGEATNTLAYSPVSPPCSIDNLADAERPAYLDEDDER